MRKEEEQMVRLIDADALIDKYQREDSVDVFRYEVIKDLDNAPTVDAVPVRHGQKGYMGYQGKDILDATCGSRSIWFDKHNEHTLYCDIRSEEYHGLFGTGNHKKARDIYVEPDMIVDFTNMPFPDNSFRLVVFDPPQIKNLTDSSWMRKMYGTLDDDWRGLIRHGFNECMRVLEPRGVLVFKWSEISIPSSELWKAIGQKPLFGHHSGKKMNTYWGVFMKEGKHETD